MTVDWSAMMKGDRSEQGRTDEEILIFHQSGQSVFQRAFEQRLTSGGVIIWWLRARPIAEVLMPRRLTLRLKLNVNFPDVMQRHKRGQCGNGLIRSLRKGLGHIRPQLIVRIDESLENGGDIKTMIEQGVACYAIPVAWRRFSPK
ncbi:hypothetical protein LMG27198_24140 [Methylocystis echinoides]|uniref:Uncharacterized protein n=1 Tax=Methylocystis echinoides TaxID=29468 RepID=A0A9W6GUR9_9HYPH|nr:hypothetical protein LMG27198_24140 [Methylocystis echinoides]